MQIPPQEDNIILPGRIPPGDICFVNSIVDDHEGMAVMRTEDASVGKMEYWVAPGLIDEFFFLMDFIRKQYDIPIEIYDPIPCSTEIEPNPPS